MANVLSTDRQLMVMRLLVEGNSLRSISRVTGVHRTAIQRWLVIFGDAARSFLDAEMRNLTLRHVQADEIWTFVQKKQGRLRDNERDNPMIGDQYLWVVFDEDTKLVPTFVIGKRSADMARRLMKDLASRLVFPGTHASDPHDYKTGGYKPIIQISTDGFAGYPEAVDLAFGPYARYGQCIKDFRNADQPGRYGPPELVYSERRPIFGRLAESEIGTSHVERNNLTIRTFVKRFARLSLGFSKKLENLAAASALHFAYFNYVWRTRYPDYSGKAGRLRPTAAMMAGVTDRLWKVEDLFDRLHQEF